MSWKQERDALIAQTAAFLQSVAGNKVEIPTLGATERPAARPAGPAAAAQADPTPAIAAAPRWPVASGAPLEPVKSVEPRWGTPTPQPIVQTDMKTEILARVASFRAHQERFNRERAEYFSATLARLRASIDEASPQRPPARGPAGRPSRAP